MWYETLFETGKYIDGVLYVTAFEGMLRGVVIALGAVFVIAVSVVLVSIVKSLCSSNPI